MTEMPRLAGIQDWQDVPIPPTAEYVRKGTKLTRQGVRDLNGPLGNGRGHNGRLSSCPHYRSPDMPVYRVETLRTTGHGTDGRTVKVMAYHCLHCDAHRYDEDSHETALREFP